MKTKEKSPEQVERENIHAIVRGLREESDARRPQQAKNIPVKHEGRSVGITVRGRRVIAAMAIAPVLLYGGNKVVEALSEDETYTGPFHVTQQEDGTSVAEGVYDTQTGENLTSIAIAINEQTHVKNPDSQKSIETTREHLRMTGGGMREDGTAIPIVNADSISENTDILVRNFSVTPKGAIKIDESGLYPSK